MAIARYPTTVLDCPDPASLGYFYGTMLGWTVDASQDWVDIRSDIGQCLSFQLVEDYRRPTWPSQVAPQQMHLDVVVDDLDIGENAVLELGAVKSDHQPGTTFRVFLDPAGHPFCLCLS